MKNLIISEFERTFKRKKTTIGLIIFGFALLLEGLFLFAMNGVSFYDANHSVQLNSINTAPFFLRELGLLIYFVLIPMFVVDSFNGEYSSGALRLVLIRPKKRLHVLLAKWFVQMCIFLGVLIVTWAAATLFGKMFMPHVTETTFYQTGTMNTFTGMLYTVAFYGIVFIIIMAVIGLCSLISMVMPNPVLAYMGTIGTLVGSLYVHDIFAYFLTSDPIFKVLAEPQLAFYLSLLIIVLISSMINIGIWKKKQWMG